MKRKARIAAAVVLAFLPIFGLLGCGESEKFTADDLVLIHTVYYGTERNSVYCFALKKEENLDIIAMIKKSSKIKSGYQDKNLNIKEIYSRNKKRRGRSRYLHMGY